MRPKIKTFLHFSIWRVFFSLGWWRGENFKLLNLTILEIFTVPHKIDQITILDIQVAKLQVLVGLRLW